MDDEREKTSENRNTSGQIAHSFGRLSNDAKSISERINNSRQKNKGITDSTPDTSLGSSPSKGDLPKDKLESNTKDVINKGLEKKGKDTLTKPTNVVTNTVTKATKKVEGLAGLLEKFIVFLKSGGWISLVIVGSVILAVLIVVIFSQVVSNFSMKFGLTGEESYEMLSDRFAEGQSREQVDQIFTEKGDDVCGTIGLGAKIRIAFGKWNLENPEELCLFLKKLLESNESSKKIKPIAPGYLFNALYYGYDSQNLDENGKQFIEVKPVDDYDDNAIDVNDFDALSTLIATKIYGNNTTQTIETIKKLFENYFYHEETHPIVTYQIIIYDDPETEEDETTWDCVEGSAGNKYFVDENKFKLYLRYGDTDDDGLTHYYQRDRIDKDTYDQSDNTCWYPEDDVDEHHLRSISVKEIIDRDYPDLSKYNTKANLNYEDKQIPTITVDSGTYGYDSGFIYTYYPRYIPEYTVSKTDPYVFDYMTPKDIEAIIENISSRQDYTNYLLGYPNTVRTTASNSYFSSGGSNCGYEINNVNVNNLKVRLTYHKSYPNSALNVILGSEIPGQELVDFEKYILGVVYAESSAGGAESLKSQAVAARSYILGGIQSGRFKTTTEGGNTIVTITNSTEDQTYCDPDKGCYQCVHSNGKNITLLATGTVPAGSSCTFRGGPLPEDSRVRAAVNQVVGQYLVTSDGKVKMAGYGSTEQNNWNAQAAQGMKYEDILAKQYTDATLRKANCTFSTGEWTKWTQLDPAWGNVRIGNKTVREVGCYMTAIAMLVADTAGKYLDANFNPGTFATKLQAQGQFTDGGALKADIPTAIRIATGNNNLNIDSISVDMSENEPYESKVSKISNYLNQGYKILLRVKSEQSRKEYYELSGHKTWWAYAQHWVYVTGVDGLDIHMADPGSSYEIVRNNPYYLNSGLIRFIAVKVIE